MKLSALNSAIRNTDKVWVQFFCGRVDLQKTSLLDALKTHFEGDRIAETGLFVSPEGQLTKDPSQCN